MPKYIGTPAGAKREHKEKADNAGITQDPDAVGKRGRRGKPKNDGAVVFDYHKGSFSSPDPILCPVLLYRSFDRACPDSPTHHLPGTAIPVIIAIDFYIKSHQTGLV